MTQPLNEFVVSVISGKTKFPSAGKSGEKIIEYLEKPDADDIEAIAAEAINRDIVDPERISWDRLIKKIQKIVKDKQ